MATLAELRRLAKQRNIRGRSQMSKAQLEHALSLTPRTSAATSKTPVHRDQAALNRGKALVRKMERKYEYLKYAADTLEEVGPGASPMWAKPNFRTTYMEDVEAAYESFVLFPGTFADPELYDLMKKLNATMNIAIRYYEAWLDNLQNHTRRVKTWLKTSSSIKL